MVARSGCRAEGVCALIRDETEELEVLKLGELGTRIRGLPVASWGVLACKSPVGPTLKARVACLEGAPVVVLGFQPPRRLQEAQLSRRG
jgi:hypothetical protein